MGRVQFAVVEDKATLAWAEWCWGDFAPERKLLPMTPLTFAKLLKVILADLHLDEVGFTPGSLRAGGPLIIT